LLQRKGLREWKASPFQGGEEVGFLDFQSERTLNKKLIEKYGKKKIKNR